MLPRGQVDGCASAHLAVAALAGLASPQHRHATCFRASVNHTHVASPRCSHSLPDRVAVVCLRASLVFENSSKCDARSLPRNFDTGGGSEENEARGAHMTLARPTARFARDLCHTDLMPLLAPLWTGCRSADRAGPWSCIHRSVNSSAGSFESCSH